MKTGLIGAMSEEIVLLKKEINNLEIKKHGSREFYSGTIGNNEVVLCLSGWGKVAAASTATSLINLFGVDRLVFIGLAGAIHPKLTIGDIVIADKLVQHDVDLSMLRGLGEVQSPFYTKFEFKTEQEFNFTALDAVKNFLASINPEEHPDLYEKYKPNVFIGTIATGDQFIASHEGKKKISDRYPEILCTEMEGAAIAQVAADYGIPCAGVRIVSDMADEDAPEHFSKFLFENISKISAGIAKQIFCND